jgi:hypothetical protein
LAVIALHPHVILRGEDSACLTSVDDPARLNNECVALAACTGDMFDTHGYNEQFSPPNGDRAIAETYFHLTLKHQEDFVGVLVVMPNKLPFELHELVW